MHFADAVIDLKPAQTRTNESPGKSDRQSV